MRLDQRMHKRILAAFCAAFFLVGLPASAEWSIGVPTLGTHPLPYNYLGQFQCIVTNHGNYAIETNVTLLNHVSESVVASASYTVPGKGQRVLTYQSFSGTLENHSCWATLGNGFNNTIPNCNEQVVYVPLIRGGAMPEIMLQSRVWNFQPNPARENGVVRMTKIGECNDAS